MIMAQMVSCKCGVPVAACSEPTCYEDAEWQRDVRKYIKKGYTVSTVECSSISFKENCKCEGKQDRLFKDGEK